MLNLGFLRHALTGCVLSSLLACSSDERSGPDAGAAGGGGGNGGAAGADAGAGGSSGSGGAMLDATTPDDGSTRDAAPPDDASLDATTPETDAGCSVDTHCPDGRYCDSVTRTCEPGCRAPGQECASGVCNSAHECAPCLSDEECGASRTCSTGQCLPDCSDHPECPDGWSCCTDRCADPSRDFLNCGACGNACNGEQFCSGTSCEPALVASLCETRRATFLLDGLPNDDAAAAQVRDALVAACPSPPETSLVPQETSGKINASTGRPVAGSGDLLVVLGGSFGQALIRYLEGEGITRIYNTYDEAAVRFYARTEGATDRIIVDAPQATVTDTHSYFLVESVVDPASHTWVLEIYGLSAVGTDAAAWFFINRMLTDVAAFDQRYYVYEWTDGDGDLLPSDGDTFDLLESG